MIDVTDYGAVGDWNGSSGTDNFDAFEDALAAAISAGKDLFIPKGAYYIAITLSPLTPLDIDASIRIIGEGKTNTSLVFGPMDNDAALIGLRATGAYDVILENLTIKGPNAPEVGSFGYYTEYGGSIKFKDVIFSDWVVDCKNDSGGAALYAEDTEFSSCLTNIIVGEVAATEGVKQTQTVPCYFESCTFDIVHKTSLDPITYPEHNIYTAHGVSLSVKHSRFRSHTGCAVWINGGTGPCYFFDIHNCMIEEGNSYINTSHRPPHVTTPSKMERTYQGSDISSDTCIASIEDCLFKVAGSRYGIWVGESGAIVRGCIFVEDLDRASATTMAYGAVQDYDDVCGPLILSDCVFDMRCHEGMVELNQNDADHGYVIINHCYFNGRYYSTSKNMGHFIESITDAKIIVNDSIFKASGDAMDEAMHIRAGSITMNRCVVDVGYRDVLIQAYQYGPVSAEFNDCKFSNSAAAGTYSCGGLSVWDYDDAVTIRGRNNTFSGGYGGPGWTDFGDHGGRGYLQPPAAFYSSTIASASSIELLPNYSHYHITGTTTINTITIDGKEADCTKLWLGPFTLIADGAWALGTTGNIKTNNTSARTANDVATLVYDVGTGYWYEV